MKKVLLIRFSSIGDIVLTTPVIRAIKKQTACQLHVLTKTKYAAIFESNPNIDRIHHFESNPNEIIGALQAESYDFVVDLQKNYKSDLIRFRLSKPYGTFPKLNIEKWLLVNFKINRLPSLHVVDRYFEAVKKLGIKNDGLGLDYFIPAKDEVDISKNDASLNNGFAGFAIGGQHFTKILPASKAVSILNKLPFPVILLGGKDDNERAAEIISQTTHTSIVNLCGQLNLNQSASVIRQASLVITNDTGLMHIASAFSKPIVSIWGNTVPQFGMYPYLPARPELSFIAEVEGLKCRPCSKLGHNRCPKNHFNCMLQQDEEQIVTKARELFGSK